MFPFYELNLFSSINRFKAAGFAVKFTVNYYLSNPFK